MARLTNLAQLRRFFEYRGFDNAQKAALVNSIGQDLEATSSLRPLETEAGTGVTTATGVVYETSVQKIGGLFKTEILVDLTGLASVATDNDIVGFGAGPAHLGQITAAQNGTIVGGTMVCLETPAGGEVDLNLWSANEATGVLDALITSLTGEITPVDRAGDWAANDVRAIGAVVPAANQYLYLAVGTASTPTAGTYTAGKFLITLYGV